MRTFTDELNQYAKVYQKVLALDPNQIKGLPKSFIECIKLCRETCPVVPSKKLKLDNKEPCKQWVKKEFKRADGMTFEKWDKVDPKVEKKYTLRAKKFNLFVYNILNFNDLEYETFLKDVDWTIDETKYLVGLYKKYGNL